MQNYLLTQEVGETQDKDKILLKQKESRMIMQREVRVEKLIPVFQKPYMNYDNSHEKDQNKKGNYSEKLPIKVQEDSYSEYILNGTVKSNDNSRNNLEREKKDHQRKIRTTITKQKLSKINKIFKEYTEKKSSGQATFINLRQIGLELNLGYSTILHKYRQFRSTQQVVGGTLINSINYKRKYRKSILIEQILKNALQEKEFYTAVELSKYITDKYCLKFTRSIISRHLSQMGYSYKNLKHSLAQKNKLKYKQIRKIYADILIPLIQKGEKFIYIDELVCSLGDLKKMDINEKQMEIEKQKFKYRNLQQQKENKEYILEINQEQTIIQRLQGKKVKIEVGDEKGKLFENQKSQMKIQNGVKIENKNDQIQPQRDSSHFFISVLIVCTSYGIIFTQIQNGFLNRQRFYEILKGFLHNVRQQQKRKYFQGIKGNINLVIDLNKIHRDELEKTRQMNNLLLQQNVQLFYLPPYSPKLNPCEQIFSNLKKKLKEHRISTISQLWDKLEECLYDIKKESIEREMQNVISQLYKARKEADF